MPKKAVRNYSNKTTREWWDAIDKAAAEAPRLTPAGSHQTVESAHNSPVESKQPTSTTKG